MAPFTGTWQHPEWGQVTFRLEDGRLYLDAGDLSGEVVTRRDWDGAIEHYVLVSPPQPPRLLFFDTEAGSFTLDVEDSTPFRRVPA